VELTGQRSVPVTTIGEQIIIGYNPNGIRELLG
ncbi:MAG TPA: NrdH-redoxin, partial [Firmicutes bacterium]|nr:NrdH-redoxin [Bacillota bacterium]